MALLRLPALPTHAAGLPLAEAARSLGAYVLAAAGLQTAVTVGVRGTRFEKNVRNAAGDGDAAPLFSYLVCLVAQSTLFPALLALSVAQFPGLHAHCTATFAACDAAGGTCWMRVLAFVLVAYLCKDLHLCDAMELLHHAAGIVVTSGFMLQKRGMFGYVTGCMALEFANFFMNLATVWPYRASRRRAYLASVVAMSVSHVVGAYVAPVIRPPSRVADEAEPPPAPSLLLSQVRHVPHLRVARRRGQHGVLRAVRGRGVRAHVPAAGPQLEELPRRVRAGRRVRGEGGLRGDANK